MVLRPWRRHEGPQQPPILVTPRPETVPARQLVARELRRCWVARLIQARNGVVGLGQHPVTPQVHRGERAVVGAIMASLRLLQRRAQAIPADTPWSAWRVHQALAWEVRPAPCERSTDPIARRWRQVCQAA